MTQKEPTGRMGNCECSTESAEGENGLLGVLNRRSRRAREHLREDGAVAVRHGLVPRRVEHRAEHGGLDAEHLRHELLIHLYGGAHVAGGPILRPDRESEELLAC